MINMKKIKFVNIYGLIWPEDGFGFFSLTNAGFDLGGLTALLFVTK